jgi:multidrug efflux pump subunit AcrA (membrane-fusion protein)
MSEQENSNLDDGTQDPQTDPTTGNGPGQGDSDPETNGDAGEVTFTDEQQAKLDQIIADRLERQRTKLEAEAEEARQEAEQEAEEARLAEQQEFQQLAETRKAKLDELQPQLETLQERVERYEEAVSAQVEQAMARVPAFVKPLLEQMDPVEQLAYIAEHEEEFATESGGSAGPPKTPKPNGDGDMTDKERRRRATSARRIWSG